MDEANSNNHRNDAFGELPHGGGNGRGMLDRPISALSDTELAGVKEDLVDRLRLRETIGEEAAAASEKFRRIIEEIEPLPEC